MPVVRVVKKQINREKLLDQGVNMLMAQGYHGTGLQEILDAVRIPKVSFYVTTRPPTETALNG